MSSTTLVNLLTFVRLKFVDFTSSGTFVPANYGLVAGDVVWLRMVGGGAGGAYYAYAYRGGDAGEYLDWVPYVIANPNTPIPVTIGAGGAPTTSSMTTNPGGNSSFGSVVAAGGPPGGGVSEYSISGRGAAGAGAVVPGRAVRVPGGAGVNGWARGGHTGLNTAPPANTGDGGWALTTPSAGATGRVQVFYRG